MFDLIFATPFKVVFKKKAKYVRVPVKEGSIGILKNHAPLVGIITPGVVRIEGTAGIEEFSTGSGFIEVKNNVVKILVDVAESSYEVDYNRALEELEKARQKLKKYPEDKTGYESMLKALARLKVARKKL